MNDYTAVRIELTPCNSDMTDLVAAFLADVGFESFVADDSGVTAYIPVNAHAGELARDALNDFPFETEIKIEQEFIKGENWNEEWEKNYFKPIVIAGKCVIHSSFHKDVPEADYDIVIDPKMAFGTGHHSTTSLMAQYLLDADLTGKSVIDMGTGTGILALLAKMRGASRVTGIEIDEPAYENAIENAELNKTDIHLIHSDASALPLLEPADFLLANINRNIILGDIDAYAKALKDGGTMFLSGFYTEDIPMILSESSKYGLRHEETRSDNNWAAVKLIKRV